MSSSQKTDEELLALAKKQFLLPSSAHSTFVPKYYLAELKKHTSIFPDDTHFSISRQPGSGFGIITCLEQGCNGVRISLTRSSMASDGGKTDGVGSLMAYREHINSHPTHKSNRKARLSRNSSPIIRSIGSRSNSNSSYSGTSSSSGKSRLKLVGVIDSARSSSPRMLSSSGSIALTGPTSVPNLSLDHARMADSNIARKRLLEDGPGGCQTKEALAVRGQKRIAGGVKVPFAQHDDNKPSSPPTVPSSSVTQVSLPPSSSITPESSAPMIPATSWEDWGMIASNSSAGHAQGTQSLVHHADVPHPSTNWNWPPSSGTYDMPSRMTETIAHELSSPYFDDSSLAASSSRSQLPYMPTPLQAQMQHDPLFRTMERLSGMPNPLYEDEDLYGPGRGMFRDPLARAEDLHEFFQLAGNAEQFDTNTSVTDALKRLDLPNLGSCFPGLGISLMPHQVIGVSWMLDKEHGVNKGGILSDEMGLGKTVQMIATVTANRSDDPAVKTTLIVAPLALLGQWKLEIELKTNNGLSVHIHHSAEKAKMKKTLQKADVVLTTYTTLAQEWFDVEAYEKDIEMEASGKKKKRKRKDGFITSDSEDEKVAKKRKKSGLLFTMKWHRVVLDEAQYIRNKRTRSSKAVTELDATYRWCLTGTPITNGLEDAFGLLRFLQIRPWNDWDEFNDHIALRSKREPNLCSARLQAIFATCLLRRKKDSKLDGKKLIELPSKDVQLVRLEFSPEEQEIYKAIETRSQIRFNRYLRAGTVLKNYAQVLVLLLRLRQICTHASLITEHDGVVVDDGFNNTAGGKRDDLIKAHTEMGRNFVDELKKKLRNVALERIAAERESADAAIIGEECPICFDVFTDPVVTACMHFFCRECIDAHLTAPTPDDGTLRPDERACPVCRGPVCKRNLFSRSAFEPTDEELNIGKKTAKVEEVEEVKPSVNDENEGMPDVSSLLKSSTREKGKPKSSGKPKKSRKKYAKRVVLDSDEEEEDDDDDDLSDFIVHTDEDEEEKDERRALQKKLGKRRASSPIDYQESETDEEDDDVVFGRKKAVSEMDLAPVKTMSRLLPSTKMKHMMDNLERWSKEHPDEKTMVISQWTQALDLVSAYLASRGVSHVKFQGNMSRERRDKAIRIFMKRGGATVMLMSLKCGGVGLNLTRANRVISLDLGWSEAVENQAFDRVHRLGQMLPVFVERLVISNTVEDRVLALQEKKRNLADGSLGEGNGQKIGRLTVRELANLFGLDQYGNRLHD